MRTALRIFANGWKEKKIEGHRVGNALAVQPNEIPRRGMQMKGTSQATKASETDLAMLAIEAHGGLERWNSFTTVSVHGINGGVLWGAKGKAGVIGDVTVTVDLRNEKLSHWPFGSPDRRSRFEDHLVLF